MLQSSISSLQSNRTTTWKRNNASTTDARHKDRQTDR